MHNMLNVRGFLPLAVVALAFGACGTKDKDGTTDQTNTDNTADTDETVDSSDPNDGFFRPASASISFELAYNADHELTTFSIDGTEGSPSVAIQFTDAKQATCTLLYELDIAAFNTYLGATDTDTPSPGAADYTTWLDNQGLIAGMVLADGLYTPLISQGCELDPADYTDDPHGAFLGGTWQMGWTGSIPEGVQSVLDDNGGIAAVFGADFDEAKAIGGYVRVPANFFGDGTRNLEAAGLVGEVNGAGEVQSDVDGNLVLIDAADTYGPAGPNAGFVRIFSLFGITFQ